MGKNADENDADEIIDIANKASVKDQHKQVQENIHFQFKNICKTMDEILLPDGTNIPKEPSSSPSSQNIAQGSGLSFAVGKGAPSTSDSGE